jgi:hypothetical protein
MDDELEPREANAEELGGESQPEAAEAGDAVGSSETRSLDEMVARLGAEPAEAGPAEATDDEPELEAEGGTESEAALSDVSEGEPPVEVVPGAAPEPEGVAVADLVRDRLTTRVPFWVYGAVWAGFVGFMAYLLWPISSEPFVNSPDYAALVFGAVALLAGGIVLGFFVWLFSRLGTTRSERVGLVRAVAFRTAGWMTAGVVIWWIALVLLDLHRSGVVG